MIERIAEGFRIKAIDGSIVTITGKILKLSIDTFVPTDRRVRIEFVDGPPPLSGSGDGGGSAGASSGGNGLAAGGGAFDKYDPAWNCK